METSELGKRAKCSLLVYLYLDSEIKAINVNLIFRFKVILDELSKGSKN